MSISKETLRGYLLEEALAYLIKNAGYNLLVDERQDPQELKNEHHGIVVKGRGAEHQADVLGQLNWIPAFTYPIRLFVEAKFRKSKTGINTVRNAVGIIQDINQNFHIHNRRNVLIKRYSYNYAIFSTSGFTKDAEDMAFAHGISLIDLRNPDFNQLLDIIDNAADLIVQRIFVNKDFSNNQDSGVEKFTSEKNIISQMRKYIRTELHTIPEEYEEYIENYNYRHLKSIFNIYLSEMLNTVRKYGELFMGMANGPFLLVLKADDPERFLAYSREYPTHEVSISWSREIENGRLWTIQPFDKKEGYKLSFVLPDKLGDWIFNSTDPINYARDVKGDFLSNITIYRLDWGRDYLFRLIYRPREIKQNW